MFNVDFFVQLWVCFFFKTVKKRINIFCGMLAEIIFVAENFKQKIVITIIVPFHSLLPFPSPVPLSLLAPFPST